MEHRTLEQIKEVADVHPDVVGRGTMSVRERLERWSELLRRERGNRLNTLEGTEYQTGEAQARMRADNSPITVAYSDPVLRAEGLGNDTYGEAKRFFELSDWQLHGIVCYCHLGATMSAEAAAARVGSIAGKARSQNGLARVWQALTG